MGARHYWRVFRTYMSLHVKTAMEYRANFFAQAGFMLANDLLWIVIWYYLFLSFGTVNGYGSTEAIVVYAIACLAIGLGRVFLGNTERLNEVIMEGKLDYYLSLPIDELFHAAVGRSPAHAIGDVAFGVLVLGFAGPKWLVLGLAFSLLAAIVYVSLITIGECVAFVVERPNAVAKSLRMLTMGFATWPIDVFSPGPRLVLYIIPIAFIGMVPYKLFAGFTLAQFGLLVGVAVVLATIAWAVFRAGLRRYESGNLIVTRG